MILLYPTAVAPISLIGGLSVFQVIYRLSRVSQMSTIMLTGVNLRLDLRQCSALGFPPGSTSTLQTNRECPAAGLCYGRPGPGIG